jgi:hypothetical protein
MELELFGRVLMKITASEGRAIEMLKTFSYLPKARKAASTVVIDPLIQIMKVMSVKSVKGITFFLKKKIQYLFSFFQLYKGLQLFPISRFKSLQSELLKQAKYRVDAMLSYCNSVVRLLNQENINGYSFV